MPTVASLPRLATTHPAAAKVNADLAGQDGRVMDHASGCSSQPGSWWYRDTRVAFANARFLSFEAFNDLYCQGAARPEAFLETPTYDLATGERVDWRQLLPPDLLAPQPRHFDLAVIKGSARMVRLYLDATPGLPRDCRKIIARDVDYFRLWLSTDAGGLVVMPDDLAHADRACADPAVLTGPMLSAIGAAPELAEALTGLTPP